MPGNWIIQQSVPVHVCDRPRYGESESKPARTGDVWQCSQCGTSYTVSEVNYGVPSDPIGQGFITLWTKLED